jgi:shikimate kinase
VILKLRRTPGIYLIGFMASGKTTIGKLLAERLGWHFADIDDDIEAREQRSIPEIFDTLGEPAFRAMESEAIAERVRDVSRGRPMVVAVGGGAAAQPGNFELLEDHGVTIWLSCPYDVVARRVTQNSRRPLARDMNRFEELYQTRREAYSRADVHIEIESDDPNIAVEAICRLPLFR